MRSAERLCPTGDFATIGAAIVAVQTSTLSGPLVLELQPTYVSTVETFPLVFSDLGTTAANTLTIRPALGATGLSISSADTTAATVDLNGAQFVTFDGRPGGVGSHAGSGVGTASQLTIENTSTSGIAVRYINEAISNTLSYVRLRSANTNRDTGTVFFSTTTGANGNDNNIVDHCDIGDGASTPATGLHSLGTTTTTEQYNSGNSVTNSNIFNFHSTTTTSKGVYIDSGSKDWTLTGNSFYQTISRAAVPSLVTAIDVAGENTTVTGNFIGGSAPNAGGTPWTATGTSTATVFYGINLFLTTTPPSNVQGNTIANMLWSTASTNGAAGLPGIWNGIFVSRGNVNIGTVTGNTIGSGTGTGSISVTTSGNGGTSIGIGVGTQAGSNTVAISNNTIGSITVNGSATTVSASLVGIQVTAGTNTISNNTVGSTTTANSLNAATSSTATTGQRVSGILSSSTLSANITGNTVANLNNNYAGTANGTFPPGSVSGQIRGIVSSAGVNTITSNTVRNLSTTSANSNGTINQSVYGIVQTSTLAGQAVSQNTVHSLANTAASAAVSVTGIYFAGPTSGVNVIARNLVHSLAVSSSSGTSQLKGMEFAAGAFTAQNNMVRVGIKADGTSTAGSGTVRGLFDNSSTAGRNFYHNSVYVGGTQTSGAASTLAFQSTGATNARTYQNNLFVNARSNSGGTGKHYAAQYGGTTVNPTGLTAGGNLFLASGTGGVLGLYNGADCADLSAWQSATGQDATSYNVDPRFINPTGTAATVDLHLQTVNPAEAKGVAGTGVTDDFDGQTRSSYSPDDIGADAGNFTYAASSTEMNPVISYTPAANTNSTANRVLTGFATITDDVSVAVGGDASRLYFKKSTEADAFVGNTAADNGWKYVTAGNASSPYDFTVDYALLTSSVGGGDVIQYFVVAQDGAGNFASSPSGAAYSSTAAPVTTVNARPATVPSYRILSTDLSALTLSSGTLAPGFAANVTSYTATVANSVSSLLVTPTPADPTATVTVNGSTPASPVGLSVGANTLTIVVTASDSTTKTYTVTVTRAAPPAPDIGVAQTSAVADGGSIDFGTVTLGSSSAAKTFIITNPGTADLTSLAITGATSEFTVSSLSGTSIPVGSGSVTFSVTFTPSASGTRTATLQIASNVVGAKNPYDITLTGDASEPNNAPTITSNGGGASASISVDENSTAVSTIVATDNDTPAQTITYSKSGADAALFSINSTNGTLTFVVAPDFETNPGPFNITVTATDNGSPNLSDSQVLTISITDLADTPQQLWRAANFAGVIGNTGSAANTADSDGDTYSNLLEYAFGTDPNNPASGPGEITFDAGAISLRAQPKLTVTNTATGVNFRANFGRRKDYVAAGLTYKVQFSADMQTWQDSTATPTVLASDAEMDAVSVKYPFFLQDGRKAQYYRVEVSVP